MRRKIFLINLHLIFVLLLFSSPGDGNETSLTLIYTSNTLGEVEPCSTCPMEKISKALKSYRTY
jgi:hypothetical protein